MKTIFVVGWEWRFRALLRAQLREQGYDAQGFETLAEAAEALVSAPAPALVVFDTTDSDAAETATYLREWAGRLPVVLIAGTQEEVPSGAAHVLRRPATIGQITTLVAELLK
jgi:DNA-binding NtrC family response regulator